MALGSTFDCRYCGTPFRCTNIVVMGRGAGRLHGQGWRGRVEHLAWRFVLLQGIFVKQKKVFQQTQMRFVGRRVDY